MAQVLGVQFEWPGEVLQYLSPSQARLDPFLKGVIDGKDVVFFLSFIAFFLFLTVRAVESRKWR